MTTKQYVIIALFGAALGAILAWGFGALAVSSHDEPLVITQAGTPKSGIVRLVGFKSDGTPLETNGELRRLNVISVDASGNEARIGIIDDRWVGIIWNGKPFRCSFERSVGWQLILSDYLPIKAIKLKEGEKNLQALQRARDEDHRS